MMILGRLQIGRPPPIMLGFGWRRVFWEVYWLDLALERRCLECVALNVGIRPVAGESNEALRERIAYLARRIQ